MEGSIFFCEVQGGFLCELRGNATFFLRVQPCVGAAGLYQAGLTFGIDCDAGGKFILGLNIRHKVEKFENNPTIVSNIIVGKSCLFRVNLLRSNTA